MNYPGFFESVLQQIGAPVTENNLRILNNWQRFEGGNATFNPLNTTKTAPGTTNYNSAGVKNYPDFQTGTTATAKTLLLNYYTDIVKALRENKNFAYWFGHSGIIQNLNTWGTVNLANELKKGTAPADTTKKKVVPALIAILGISLIIYANE